MGMSDSFLVGTFEKGIVQKDVVSVVSCISVLGIYKVSPYYISFEGKGWKGAKLLEGISKLAKSLLKVSISSLYALLKLGRS